MRWSIVALLCTGCPVQGNQCNVDNECEAVEVCARDHVCVPPDQVRATITTWSFPGGVPADTTSCDGLDMQIIFADPSDPTGEDKLGFAPVPCFVAQFTVDKLPVRYTRVRLNVDGGDNLAVGDFDADGMVQLELPAR